MKSKYGSFTDEQFETFKQRLHSKVHWLLVYREADDCDFLDDYFENLLRYFSSLNTLLENNANIIDLLVVLEMARAESLKKDCNVKVFRKNVLEAHNIINRL